MTTTHQYPICGKLRRTSPASSSIFNAAPVNPDGPEAAAVIESLVEALKLSRQRLSALHAVSGGHFSNDAKVERWCAEIDELLASIKS
jgi:hypothetical protein